MPIGITFGSSQVSMIENVIADMIIPEQVRLQIVFVLVPIVGESLRSKDKDVLVPGRIVFHDRQRGKGLTQTDRIGKDASVVFFKLVDNADGPVFLEGVKFLPDEGILIACGVVRHVVFRKNIIKEILEDIV